MNEQLKDQLKQVLSDKGWLPVEKEKESHDDWNLGPTSKLLTDKLKLSEEEMFKNIDKMKRLSLMSLRSCLDMRFPKAEEEQFSANIKENIGICGIGHAELPDTSYHIPVPEKVIIISNTGDKSSKLFQTLFRDETRNVIIVGDGPLDSITRDEMFLLNQPVRGLNMRDAFREMEPISSSDSDMDYPDYFPNKGEFVDDDLLRCSKSKKMKVNSRFEGRNLFKKKNKKGGMR